ncbi:MAG TPA: hypothetical protein VGX97_00750, partial [bacterium]|nr:hypothetical protein [bacterium]
MAEVQAFADRWQPPLDVADTWRHLAPLQYPEPTAEQMPWGAPMLAMAGIEPHRSRFLKGLESDPARAREMTA